MSYYVHRIHPEDNRAGWIGPIRSERQAGKEVKAWQDCGWLAWMHFGDSQVRAAVREWEKQVRENREMAR